MAGQTTSFDFNFNVMSVVRFAFSSKRAAIKRTYIRGTNIRFLIPFCSKNCSSGKFSLVAEIGLWYSYFLSTIRKIIIFNVERISAYNRFFDVYINSLWVNFFSPEEYSQTRLTSVDRSCHLVVKRPSTPTGPREWMRPVEMPTSAPKPKR